MDTTMATSDNSKQTSTGRKAGQQPPAAAPADAESPAAAAAVPDTEEEIAKLEADIAAMEARRARLELEEQRRKRTTAMAEVREGLTLGISTIDGGDDYEDVLAAITTARDRLIEAMREAGVKIPRSARGAGGAGAGSGGSGRGTKVSTDGYDRRVLTVLMSEPDVPYTGAQLIKEIGAESQGGAVPNAAKSLLVKDLTDTEGNPLPGKVHATTVNNANAYYYTTKVDNGGGVLDGVTGK